MSIRRYLIALLVSSAIIAGLFVLHFVMHWRMEFYLTHPVVIPLWERILVGIARFWGVFWPLGSIFIVGASLGVAHFLHFMEQPPAPSDKANSGS